MNFEVLKKNHLKRNILVGVGVIVIVSACILTFSLAKYRNTKSIQIAKGTINYSFADLNILAIYQEDESGGYSEITRMPESGYSINEEKSYCEVNGAKDSNVSLYTNSIGEHVIAKIQKGSKCYLYFDATITVQELIVSKNIDNSRSGEITGTFSEDTTGTIYSVEDDDGISYVYAGAPTDNWLFFAGFYWRIIRINGDGSIRIIYSGNNESGPVEKGGSTQIGTNAFNERADDNAYVGYMYGAAGSDTYEETHANINDSTIKNILDMWYQSNLISYSEYISIEAGFCNDRKATNGVVSGYGDLGYETTPTAYAPFGRLYQDGIMLVSSNPTLICSQANDYFTSNKSTKGNKVLNYSIGLITSDEVVLVGGFGGRDNDNTNYYLHTGQAYWTMSSQAFGSDLLAGVFVVYSDGYLGDGTVSVLEGIRPVINLRADVKLSGSGTSSDPYVVVGA